MSIEQDYPLNAAGPLPDEAFGVEGVDRMLEGAVVHMHQSVCAADDPNDTARHVTLLHVTSYGAEAGDGGVVPSYQYTVVLTGTVFRPAAGFSVRWLGLRHLVGSVYHASGWLPWDLDQPMRIEDWDREAEIPTEPAYQPPVTATATSTEEPAS